MSLLRLVGPCACAVALGCDPQPPPASTPVVDAPSEESAPAATATSKRSPASDCDALVSRGATDLLDAALVVRLCPEHAPSRRELRAALLQIDHPDGVAELLPQLDEAPEFSGIARLIRRAPVEYDTLPASHDDPRAAIVSPADDHVLAQVDAAIANATRSRVGPGDRIRGRAYLAKTYGAALDALGLPRNEPLPPFARRLAGSVLHWGVGFCVSYASVPQRGYQPLRAETELRILETVLALQHGSWYGDDARTILAWHDAREYLRRADVRQRLVRELERADRSHGEYGLAGEGPAGVEALFDDGVELDRLIELDLSDLAIEHGLALGQRRRPPGYGIGPIEAHLSTRLAARPRELAALRKAFESARRLRPPPPELGGAPWETEARVPDTEAVTDEVLEWIASAPGGGFARRHAVARAIETARTRPDVMRAALAHPDLPAWAHQWFLALLETRGDRSEATRLALASRSQAYAEADRADPLRADEALRRQSAGLRLASP